MFKGAAALVGLFSLLAIMVHQEEAASFVLPDLPTPSEMKAMHSPTSGIEIAWFTFPSDWHYSECYRNLSMLPTHGIWKEYNKQESFKALQFDGTHLQLGFRSDGVVVWRPIEPISEKWDRWYQQHKGE